MTSLQGLLSTNVTKLFEKKNKSRWRDYIIQSKEQNYGSDLEAIVKIKKDDSKTNRQTVQTAL